MLLGLQAQHVVHTHLPGWDQHVPANTYRDAKLQCRSSGTLARRLLSASSGVSELRDGTGQTGTGIVCLILIGSCSGLLKGMRQTATEIRGCRAAQASVPRGSEQGICRSAGHSGRVAPRHAERNVVSLHVAPHCANVWRRWRAGCKSPRLNSGTNTSKCCSYRLALECPCTCHFAASLY